jgi:hypothetical protein
MEPLIVANKLLKPETVARLLREVGNRGWQIADRWASGWPRKTRELEAAGTLIDWLKAQANLEDETISDARVGGANSDLPDSEILALHDIPEYPVPPE